MKPQLPEQTRLAKKPGPKKRSKKETESVNAIAFAELCLVLSKGEHNREELANLVGIADTTVRRWLRYLHSRRLVYICERRRKSKVGAPKLYYSWNTNFEYKDVPHIIRLGDRVYSENYRKRKRERLGLYGIPDARAKQADS